MVARKNIVSRHEPHDARAQDHLEQQQQQRGLPTTPRRYTDTQLNGPVTSPRRGGSGSNWYMLLATGCFTALCVVVTYQVLQSVILSQRAAQRISSESSSAESVYKKTLTFEVCNGMANQRLSLLYGVILAYELGRASVVPNFLLSGVQWTDKDTLASSNNSIAMSELYDAEHLISQLSAVGVEMLRPHEAPPKELYTTVDITGMADPVAELNSQHKSTNHLYVGCPLFRLHQYYFTGANNRIMWAVLAGIQTSKKLSNAIHPITKKLSGMSRSHKYNFVHLRIEEDWVAHCQRWTKIPDGKVRNNCMNNTETLDQVLVGMNFPVTEPLYVASFWEHADPATAQRILEKLRTAGYKVVTSKDFPAAFSGDREINAIVEYEVAMGAHKFIGNSVSTFSALLLFQRRYLGRWASYYNGGNVPIAEFLPTDLLPWVFSYNSYNPQSDYMVKAAIRSALKYHTIKPYCLWSGNKTAPIYKWMAENGVTIISHQPAWADDLWHKAEPMSAQNSQINPMFKSKDLLVDNFKRMDIPILPELEEFIYVLYTEPDVYFHKKISLSTFALPLPELVGMAADTHNSKHGVDGGVMLVHVPAMRDTYEEFKLFIMGTKNGGNFPNYGAGAVGAYLQFYEESIKSTKLSNHFSAKPFYEFDPAAHLVHFQGPKPHDYLEYYMTETCSMGEVCLAAFKKALCPYTKKWHLLLNETEDDVGLSLWYACTVLYAPHLRGIGQRNIVKAAAKASS